MKLLLLDEKEPIEIDYLTLKELARRLWSDGYLVYSFKNRQLEVRRRN